MENKWHVEDLRSQIQVNMRSKDLIKLEAHCRGCFNKIYLMGDVEMVGRIIWGHM